MNSEMPATPHPILDLLRAETREEHERIEGVVPLLRGDLTLAEYRSYLLRLLGFHEPLERSLRPWEPPGSELVQQKVQWLADDLRHLGGGAVPLCQHLPALSSAARAWGCLYVIQGSTLGGRILSRHVRGTLGIEPGNGGSFLWAHGEETALVWKRFTAALAAFAAQGEDSAEVLAGARDTFTTLTHWLSREG